MKFILTVLFAISVNVYAKPVHKPVAVPASYALYDYDAHEFVAKENVDEVRSIASITKLFTAITVIRSGADLDEKVKVMGSSGGHIPRGNKISRRDLLRAMLISSDNLAAESLANAHPGGFSQFIIDVNNYVTDVIKLRETKIVDASGLQAGNVSNVNDLIEFLYVIRNEPVIRSIAAERNALITMPRGKRQITINFKNTNPQLFTYDNILISKTGTTNAAGRCVIMLVEKKGMLFAVAVLGTKNLTERSKLATGLLDIPIEAKPEPKPSVESVVEFNYF
jgi:D-alanyl-D-alanine endopeptidase (penicillin-binding protein 7)